jgi:ferritin-like metal-binding protein YciE
METQVVATLPVIAGHDIDRKLIETLNRFELQARHRLNRLERAFKLLYLVPTGNSCWVTTALLRQSWEAASVGEGCQVATQGAAASLLALKRHEMIQYETLMRWAQQCCLDEIVADMRRSLAETIVQGAILSEFAFEATQIVAENVTIFPHAVH